MDYMPVLLPWLLPLLKEYAYQPYVLIMFKHCEHIVIMPVTISPWQS